jgi:hypothetical protein
VRGLPLLLAGGLLAACATAVPGPPLPAMRYARVLSSEGAVAALTPRPTQADVDRARLAWRRAMGEALACRLPRGETLRTGLAGAVELATMSAVAQGGSGAPDNRLLAGYAKELVEQAFSPGPRPSAARCRIVARWSARARHDAQAAIGRAIASGFVPLL